MKTFQIFAALTMSVLPLAAVGTGEISGTVLDGDGKPRTGIAVAYYKLPAGPPRSTGDPAMAEPLVASRVTTDARGNFTIRGIPAGSYHLCALAEKSGDISSCETGAKPFVTSVREGGSVSGVQLVVGAGYIVRIHVQDQNGKISPKARFRISAVAANTTYKFARAVGKSSQGAEYELTIPKGVVSRLVVDTDLAVTDNQNRAIAARQQGLALTGAADVTLIVK